MRNVMQAYDQINYNKAQLRFAEQLDSVYNNFKTAAELRFDTGETGKLEFIAASSEYQQIQVLRQQAYDDIEIAKRALKQYLGIDQEIETVGGTYEPLNYMNVLDSTSIVAIFYAKCRGEQSQRWGRKIPVSAKVQFDLWKTNR